MLLRVFAGVTALLISLSSARAVATPILFHSPNDDGLGTGVAAIPIDGPFALNLWFDPGEPFFEFLLTLSADSGINLLSFMPNPGTEVDEITLGDGGSLLLEGGSKNSAQAGPFRLGRLLLEGLVPFSELVLRLLEQDDSLPGYVDQEFEYIDVPIPLVIASVPVPEPGAIRLLLLTGLALGLLRRRPTVA